MSNENTNPDLPELQSEEFKNFCIGETRKFWGMDEKTFCMLMHLSQFSSCIVPFGGLVLPIVMWATNKDQSSTVDHIFNFMLSMVIYSIVLASMVLVMAVLSAIIVGLPVGALFVLPAYMAIGVTLVVFVIIAAVKASNGEYWPYPLCIRFFK